MTRIRIYRRDERIPVLDKRLPIFGRPDVEMSLMHYASDIFPSGCLQLRPDSFWRYTIFVDGVRVGRARVTFDALPKRVWDTFSHDEL